MSRKNRLTIRQTLAMDLQAAMDKDPAATSKFMVKHTYSGYKAIKGYRKAHWYYEHNMKSIAKLISARVRRKTGIEIHPAAKIGAGFFIDHGCGIVIG